jgi:hypothetical protein
VSVYELANALYGSGLGAVYMFIEYTISDDLMAPIDVVLAGEHPDGGYSFVVVELKQWSNAERPDAANPVGIKACPRCQLLGPGKLCPACTLQWVWVPTPSYQKHKKHPAAQVYDNMVNLRKYHSLFDNRYVHLSGAAYLHNLLERDYEWIAKVRPNPGVDVQVFGALNPAGLRDFLVQRFKTASGEAAAQALLEHQRSAGRIVDELGQIVAGAARFSLVERQQKAVDQIWTALADPNPRGAKKVFIVEGRAGTGKSLIALTLLGQANQAQPAYDARYVSGGIASRDTFRRAASPNRGAFVTLNQVADWPENSVDMMLCDEAHRLTERPMAGSYHMRSGPETSVEVVVKAARVPVFFVDGDQRLFGEEVWTPQAIEDAVLDLGAEVVPISLDRVLRAMGSVTYDTWLQCLLYGEPVPWVEDHGDEAEPFQLFYAENPYEMEKFLKKKLDAGENARMTAGMCWEWKDRSGTVPEVKLPGGWERPWNAGDQHGTPDVPKRKFWATDDGGFGQIGCVHTAQGLEYEWGGVIVGPDFTWDEGWRVHREWVRSKASRITDDADLDRAVRNAYGVLMTRSLRGTVVYSTDPATRRFLAGLGLRRVPTV